MPQIVNTNINSLVAQNNLNRSQNSVSTSLQRLSSGLRINSAKDDAAGLAISERFTTQIRGLNQAIRNANDAISLAQTAEGALGETVNALQRVRELAVQSQNATNSATDRTSLNAEVQQMIAEIDRIATQTDFNGTKVLATSGGFSATFQVGANVGETVSTSVDAVRSSDLGVSTNFGTIAALSDANFATRLRTQFAGALSSSTLNGATLTDVAANSLASNKVSSVNNSTAGVTAFQYGNSLVGSANTADVAANAGGLNAGDLVINGVQVGAVAADATVANTVTAINAISGQTGVTADATAGGTLVLFNRNGAAITMSVNSANAATVTGFTNGSSNTVASGTNGSIVLNYAVGTTSLAVNATATAGALEGSTADTTVGLSNQYLTAASVTSVANSQLATLVVDQALTTVNSLRSRLGAVQNRIEATISNLSTTAQNSTASRSRIRDADFAAETANLTRAQILQQAGLAMLSQANALPQDALALLR